MEVIINHQEYKMTKNTHRFDDAFEVVHKINSNNSAYNFYRTYIALNLDASMLDAEKINKTEDYDNYINDY